MKSLDICVVLGMGVFACPIDINPLPTLMRHCRTGMRKQWRSCKKSMTLVTMLFRSGVQSHIRIHVSRNLPLIFFDTL